MQRGWRIGFAKDDMIHGRRDRQSFLPMLALHATEFLAQLGFQQALEDVTFCPCRTIFFEQALKQLLGARHQHGTGFGFDLYAGSRVMTLVVVIDPRTGMQRF
jgi:hypothetical protein